jgi:TolB protein
MAKHDYLPSEGADTPSRRIGEPIDNRTGLPGHFADPLQHDAYYHLWQQYARGQTSLSIPLQGSLQNPSWSADGELVAFTRFRLGYNKGPADVFVYNVSTHQLRQLAADGNQNVTQPGSTWTKDGRIVFSSDRNGHEEIYMMKADGSQTTPDQVTARSGLVAYEPSLSPNGRAIAFESHHVDESGRGRIVLHRLDGSNGYQYITPEGYDCRQPNWSPAGDRIVYQRNDGSRWNLWTYDLRSGQHKMVVQAATDATFSPDGNWILFSKGGEEQDRLYAVPKDGGTPVKVGSNSGYQGAPSWSPDGRFVATETSARDPGGATVTRLAINPVGGKVQLASLQSPQEMPLPTTPTPPGKQIVQNETGAAANELPGPWKGILQDLDTGVKWPNAAPPGGKTNDDKEDREGNGPERERDRDRDDDDDDDRGRGRQGRDDDRGRSGPERDDDDDDDDDDEDRGRSARGPGGRARDRDDDDDDDDDD